MRLSPHFTLKEATASRRAKAEGIINLPTPTEIICLIHTAYNILEPCRTHFGVPFSPSSWFRSLALNRALKSKDTSQHVKAEAVDFTIPGVATLTLFLFIRDALEYDQVIYEVRPGKKGKLAKTWVHCSFKIKYNWHQALSFDGKNFKNFSTGLTP